MTRGCGVVSWTLDQQPAIQKALLPALWERIMVGISSLATVIIGLPLGVVLFVTQKGGMSENRPVNVIRCCHGMGRSSSTRFGFSWKPFLPQRRLQTQTAPAVKKM